MVNETHIDASQRATFSMFACFLSFLPLFNAKKVHGVHHSYFYATAIFTLFSLYTGLKIAVVQLYLVHYLQNLQLDWTSNMSRQKNNLPTNQEGYEKSETTDEKLSARRIQICLVYFCKIYFSPPFSE